MRSRRHSACPRRTCRTSPPSIGDVEEAVLASGGLEPIRQVSVGAQATGRLSRSRSSLARASRQGDLIAEIDAVTQQNALRSAEADLAVLSAQREERQATSPMPNPC
jgi:macrolide-specific efflux system membrane fusion protein